MASEFQDLGRLGKALLTLGEADRSELAARTQLPVARVDQLIARAIDVGLAASDGNVIRLSPSGSAFAVSLRELETDARQIGHERFRPYTDYFPAEWSIE